MLREPSVALALLKLLLSDDVDGRVRAAAGELLLLHTEGYADAPGGGGAGVVVSGGAGGGGGGGSPDAAGGGAAHAAAAVAAEKEKEGQPLPRAFFAKAIDDAEIVARLLPTAVTASAAELEHASGGGRVSAEGDTPKSPSQHSSTPPGRTAGSPTSSSCSRRPPRRRCTRDRRRAPWWRRRRRRRRRPPRSSHGSRRPTGRARRGARRWRRG